MRSALIGSESNQEAEVAAFKRQVHLIAPDVFRPFQVPPTYTERRLNFLSTDVIEPFGSELSKLINSSGPHFPENKVEVGTQHVRRVREHRPEIRVRSALRGGLRRAGGLVVSRGSTAITGPTRSTRTGFTGRHGASAG
jgi:hypothetical protein